MSRRIWTYVLLPILLLNTIPVCLFGAVFALAYVQNGVAENVDTSQALLWLYVAIFIVNWGLAIFVFRKTENAVYNLIAADDCHFAFICLYCRAGIRYPGSVGNRSCDKTHSQRSDRHSGWQRKDGDT